MTINRGSSARAANPVFTHPRVAAFVIACILSSLPAGAADISARRMEIVQTPDGQETVFRDSVMIVDGATVIMAQMARFNETRGRAVISDSVRIQNPDAAIRADSAIYFLAERVIELFGQVEVAMDSVIITAPHLFYRTGEQRVDADYGMTLHTENQGMSLSGARGRYYIGRQVGEVDSLPVVLLSAPDEDTVTATARTMTWFGADESALLAGQVRVGGRASALTSDSLRYWTGSETGIAWGTPRVTAAEGGTEGDSVRFSVRDGTVRSMEVSGNAQGRYSTARSGDIEVAGQTIRIRFAGGEIETIEVEQILRGRLIQRTGTPGEGG